MDKETYESDSVCSESSENPFNYENPSMELNEGDTYHSEEAFILAAKAYAKQQGFQIRLGKVEKNAKGQIRKRTLVCNREGSPNKATCLNKRNRASQRCNCQFAVRASLNSNNGLWYIIYTRLEHNHSLVSECHRHFMSEERTIPAEVQEKILLLCRAGCNVPTIRAILKEEFSGSVTWVYNDLYNFIYQKEGTLEKREFDANNFIKELENLKSQNEEFCYEILINTETNELQQAIWMFPEQKMNYCQFYDVVVFDNTYKTNRFGMPFSIFTGVNNHGQSVCFAGAIMRDESAESFIWTFTNFLKLVNNFVPKTFLTDEDHAIIKAVDLIFVPHGTKHALCLWHLMKNIVKNLNGVLGFKWAEFIKFFYQCINEYDENEFLDKWNQLKIKYSSAAKYLSKMDKNLQRWAPCYNRQLFMADMTTTQRGESMNSLMKGYMDVTTSLTNFLKAFESALDQRKECAEYMKFCENNKVVSLLTTNPYEKQASELLTKYALTKVQEQLSQCTSYKSEKITSNSNETEVSYCVKRFGSQKKERIVKYNSKNNHFSCSCYYTIFSGIICRHILKVAIQRNLEELPQHLFPIRWRKDPSEIILVKLYKSFYNNTGELEMNQQNKDINSIEEENYEYLLNRVWYKVQQIVKAKPETAKIFYLSLDKSVKEEISLYTSKKSSQNNLIKNPTTIKPKGRVSKKRVRSYLEITKPSKRSALVSDQQNTFQNEEVKDLEANNSQGNNFGKENCPPNILNSGKINPLSSPSDNICPFCKECLPNPLPSKIRRLLNKIGKQKGKPTHEDRSLFCEIHYAETTIVPDGVQKGYPMKINFELLETRIIQIKDELLNIINKKTNSYYWDFSLEICNEIGSRKAGTPMAIMNRFEILRPGYYGSKELIIISEVLSKLFLFNNLLTYELVSPKTPVDFLQEVLVPETALRLISQDKGNISLEEARKIMKDSTNFGNYVHEE